MGDEKIRGLVMETRGFRSRAHGGLPGRAETLQVAFQGPWCRRRNNSKEKRQDAEDQASRAGHCCRRQAKLTRMLTEVTRQQGAGRHAS